MKKTGKILRTAVCAALVISIVSGCSKPAPTDTTPTGELPKPTSQKETEQTIETTPEIGETTSGEVPVVELTEQHENTGLGLTFKLPADWKVESGTAEMVRLTGPQDGVEISIVAAVGNIMSSFSQGDLKDMFKSRAEHLRYRTDGTEYKLWDHGIVKHHDELRMGDLTAYKDEIWVEYTDVKNMIKEINPFSMAYYFMYNDSAYVLVGTSPAEKAPQITAICEAVLGTIKPKDTDSTAFNINSTEVFEDAWNKVSFKYPAEMKKYESGQRIAFKADVDSSHPLYNVQITCFWQSVFFTEDYKAPDQLMMDVAKSYMRDPLRDGGVKDVANTIMSTGSYELSNGDYIAFYDLVTNMIVSDPEDIEFLPDSGLVQSHMYALTTKNGKAYCINFSSAKNNEKTREVIEEYVMKSLILQ